MSISINFPKKAPQSLIKRVDKAIKKLEKGHAQVRKTERYGYSTIALGLYERIVIIGNTFHVFNQHKSYERFINQAGRC
jgi:hypothetical protein